MAERLGVTVSQLRHFETKGGHPSLVVLGVARRPDPPVHGQAQRSGQAPPGGLHRGHGDVPVAPAHGSVAAVPRPGRRCCRRCLPRWRRSPSRSTGWCRIAGRPAWRWR
ncbi:hypothetical protein [Pseudomonas aeruginosa]|uniref:hypothetical protein n=1 Tax=Pseudomonas aeruginosa TaxID=287 RepID=UPI0039C45477